MFVLFLVGPIGEFGGVERFLADRANHLSDRGIRVEILTTRLDARPLNLNKFISVREVSSATWAPVAGSLLGLRKETRKLRPDVAVTNDATSTLATAGIAKTVYYSHGGHTLDRSASTVKRHGIARLFEHLYRIIAYKLSDLIVANSMWCRKSFTTRRIRAALNYPGVDTSVFRPLSREDARERLRRKELIPFSLLNNTPLLLTVGVLRVIKNHELFIAAFKIMNERNPNVKGVIIGEGRRRDYLQNLIRENSLSGNLYLIPGANLSDEALRLWYCASTLYVHSGEREHYGFPIAEAQACGIPAVVPDRGGGAEIVSNHATGLHFESGDPNSLAENASLLLLDADMREKFGRRARDRMTWLFDSQKVNQQFCEILTGLVDGPCRGAQNRFIADANHDSRSRIDCDTSAGNRRCRSTCVMPDSPLA